MNETIAGVRLCAINDQMPSKVLQSGTCPSGVDLVLEFFAEHLQALIVYLQGVSKSNFQTQLPRDSFFQQIVFQHLYGRFPGAGSTGAHIHLLPSLI